MKRLWIAKFIAVFFFTTVFATVVWARFVDGTIYSCSDGIMGYPIPADLGALWHDNWPLKTVSRIVQPSNMSDPDQIKEGWSAGRLWALWATFLFVSMIFSAAIASLPWPPIPRRS